MENTHCIICSSKYASSFISLNDRLSNSSKKYNLLKCICGFIYLNPRPDIGEINHYYKLDNYDPHKESFNSFWNTAYHYVQKVTLNWKYRIITKYIKKGSLLDIGGGKGEFAQFINKKGWDVTFQDNMTDLNRRENNSFFVRELSNVNSTKRFDVITLWHSLEHIHNIKYLFDSINNMLKDSGILIIAVPNMNAPERKFYKYTWAPYDAPRHLYHFNLDSLNKLCQNKGYYIMSKYSLYQDIPYNVILSTSRYSFFQLIKTILVICYTFLYTLCAGPKYSSSLLIVCKKQ